MAEEFKFPDELESPVTAPDARAESEVEVEVVDDTPERDKNRRPLDKPVEDPTDEELGAYSEKVQSRIKELTHARHDERRAKESVLREKQELENAARRLLEENRKLKEFVNTGEQYYAETAKTAAVSQLEMAKRQYKDAYESGDSDALVAAQEALTEAKMRMEAAKNYKPTPLQDSELDVQHTQPVSQEQAKPSLDEKTQRWMARNQWFGDPKYRAVSSYALGLHQELVDSGVDPRTDEYFERIDSSLRTRFPEVFEGDDSKPKAKRPSTVVAPATRASGPRKITLTTSQVAIAKRLGLTPQQYAMEMAKLERSNG